MTNYVKRIFEGLLERNSKARPIMVVVRGSSLWGDNLPDSDLDIGVVWDREPEDYISLSSKTQVYAWKDGNLDIEAMELTKVMGLLNKGNLNYLIWMTADGRDRWYMANRAWGMVDGCMLYHHTGLVHHLLGQARSMKRRRLKPTASKIATVGMLRMEFKALYALNQVLRGYKVVARLPVRERSLMFLARMGETEMLLAEVEELWDKITPDLLKYKDLVGSDARRFEIEETTKNIVLSLDKD